MNKQNAIVKMIRIFLMAAMLGLISVVAAHAETVFVANLDGQQQVPPTNSTAKGFMVLVVNEAQNRAEFQLYFSGLQSLSTNATVHFPGAAGENGPSPVLFTFGSGGTLGSVNGTLILTPQDAQHLKNGLWYVKVSSVNLPNGEIRGQFQPYSPLIAKMSGAQTVPASASPATGEVYFAMNKDESLMVYYYKFSGVTQGPARLTILASTPGQNGTWETDLTAPSGVPTDDGIGFRHTDGAPSQEFIARLKRGLLYVIVSTAAAYPVGEIRGQIKPLNKITDFDGDNRADISVFRGNEGVWYQIDSLDNQAKSTQFGVSGDVPAHADYDGDGVTDIAVYRASIGEFYVQRSRDNVVQTVQWGQAGDKPAVADYDGDGKADFAISRPNVAWLQFWVLGSLNNSIRVINFGRNGDQFLPADFDGDRVNDLTVYRYNDNSFYSILSSNGAYKVQQWGLSLDDPQIVDFDGDGKSEYVVYRRGGSQSQQGTWWILYHTGVVSTFKFGFSSDRSVPSDYDGDGRADFAIYRDGDWWIRKSSNGTISVTRFGLSDDIPLPR